MTGHGEIGRSHEDDAKRHKRGDSRGGRGQDKNMLYAGAGADARKAESRIWLKIRLSNRTTHLPLPSRSASPVKHRVWLDAFQATTANGYPCNARAEALTRTILALFSHCESSQKYCLVKGGGVWLRREGIQNLDAGLLKVSGISGGEGGIVRAGNSGNHCINWCNRSTKRPALGTDQSIG